MFLSEVSAFLGGKKKEKRKTKGHQKTLTFLLEVVIQQLVGILWSEITER